MKKGVDFFRVIAYNNSCLKERQKNKEKSGKRL